MNVKQENNFLETISDGDVNFYNPSDPQKFKNISLFERFKFLIIDLMKFFCNEIDTTHISQDTFFTNE